jgi:hypothetical protein
MLEAGWIQVLDEIHKPVFQPSFPEMIDNVQNPDWHMVTAV